MKAKLVKESLNEKFTTDDGENHWLKKGLVVKIKSAEEIKKSFPGLVPGYINYMVQIAGKIVTIKKAFRSPGSGGYGPIDEFSVEGIPLYRK